VTGVTMLYKRSRMLRAIKRLDFTKPGPGFSVAASPGGDRWIVQAVNRGAIEGKVCVGDVVMEVNGETTVNKKGISHLLRGKPYSEVHIRLLRIGGGGRSGGERHCAGERWAEWHEASNTFKGFKQGEQDSTDDVFKVVLLRVPRAEAGGAAGDGSGKGGGGEGAFWPS